MLKVTLIKRTDRFFILITPFFTEKYNIQKIQSLSNFNKVYQDRNTEVMKVFTIRYIKGFELDLLRIIRVE